MRAAIALITLCFTSTAAAAPLFIYLKNLPAWPDSLDSPPSSESHPRTSPRIPSMEDHLGFVDRLSDAPSRRVAHTISPPHDPSPEHQLSAEDLRSLRAEIAGVVTQTESSPTIAELETDEVFSHIYAPCPFHEHYLRVRKYGDRIALGLVVSFVALWLLIHLWKPVCGSMRRLRSGEGVIRLEDGEKANHNFQREECITHQSFIIRSTSKPDLVLSPIAEKHEDY
ncbi:hypothetical protein DL770_006934 [Monosporascus sp. CRB-9-2]|nr:hypothetical protein DL770_006934 [Monosporascus sp. CRB-9-2]